MIWAFLVISTKAVLKGTFLPIHGGAGVLLAPNNVVLMEPWFCVLGVVVKFFMGVLLMSSEAVLGKS